MKKNISGLILICILFCVCTSTSYANSIKKFNLSAPEGFENAPIVKVSSLDGEKWSLVDKSQITDISVNLKAKCKYQGKGNKAYKGQLYATGFQAIGDTEPRNFLIPHSSAASGKFQYVGEEKINLAKICNDELKNKVANVPGQTLEPKYRKFAFLSKGFKVNYPNAIETKYTFYCKATGIGKSRLKSKYEKVNAIIDCQPSALAKEKIPKKPIEVKTMQLVKLVSKVSFMAKPKLISGQCKAGVDFDGAITSSRTGEVKYQYVSKDGSKSPVFTLNFKKAGTLETSNWHDTVSKPDTTNSFALAGSSKTPDISGWWRLDIISPQSNKSATAKYAVTCPKAATIVKPIVKPRLKQRGN